MLRNLEGSHNILAMLQFEDVFLIAYTWILKEIWINCLFNEIFIHFNVISYQLTASQLQFYFAYSVKIIWPSKYFSFLNREP